MEVLVNGKFLLADVGLVKGFKENTVIFAVKDEEIEMSVDETTKMVLQEIIVDDDETLFPLDLARKIVLLDAEPLEKIEY